MKRFLYFLGLMGVLAVSLLGFHKVFSFKYGDGIYSVTTFYEQEEDSVDLLILGSSHAYQNINPMILWKDAGIAAYDLCGSITPLWNSYYFLKEAVKTQSPRLVILEAYCLTQPYEYMDDSRIIKNVYGLKPSENKLDALKVSAPEDRWVEFGLGYIQYHNRYSALEADDFRPYQDDPAFYASWKGFGNNFGVIPYEAPQVVNDGSTAPIYPKQQEYYEKIIAFCKKEGLPLLVVVSPYAGYTQGEMQVYNTAKQIAQAAGVPFVNFNDDYNEIGLDWSTDAADPAHLSYLGNKKFTETLGEYLLEHYTWEDHSAEREKYASWDAAYDYYDHSMRNKALSLVTDAATYLATLDFLGEEYIVILEPGATFGAWDLTKTFIQNHGIGDPPEQGGQAWILQGQTMETVTKTPYGYYWAQRFGKNELLVDDSGVYWNRKNYKKSDNDINIVVFDTRNQTVADAVCITENAVVR